MNTNTENSIRPTKKQRELLSFIEQFIAEHGYSPSYREIMNGQGYTSVATVSLHVNSLIRRGHLRKRDRSARSLEVVRQGTTGEPAAAPAAAEAAAADDHQTWLLGQAEQLLQSAEKAEAADAGMLADLQAVLQALDILLPGRTPDDLADRLKTLEAQAA